MLAAASAAEAMAKVRQKARLCQSPARSGAGFNAADSRASMPSQTAAGGATEGTPSANLPRRASQKATSAAKQGSLASRNSARRRSCRPEHAKHIFGSGQVVMVARTNGVFIAHRSRHVLSFNSPRLIQLFMVPSGTRAFSANSSYVNPSRNAERIATD
jgi:hypothetical protein